MDRSTETSKRSRADFEVSPAVDAKSEAELLIVCAATNFPVGSLTQFERFLWSQAFRRGAVFGLEVAKVEIRAMGAA